MASHSRPPPPPPLLLLFILLATAPSVLSITFNGKLISTVQIGGGVYCTTNGNPWPFSYPPRVVPRTPIELRCRSGGSTNNDDEVVKTVMTDESGKYEFDFDAVDALPFSPRSCYVVVHLPLASCTIAPSRGELRAPVSAVEVVEALMGKVLKGFVGPFSYIGY